MDTSYLYSNLLWLNNFTSFVRVALAVKLPLLTFAFYIYIINHWIYLMRIALTHHQIILASTNNNNNHNNNERTCIFLWTLELRMTERHNEKGEGTKQRVTVKLADNLYI
uniref:Uncharacterized protein n=1 Tax=Glossina austeni TaxID=7395 RepID=A0A1A9UG57_GLOAU